MCIDGDNSGHVTEHINAQLESLHKIALECISHYHESHEHGGEDPATLPGYDFTLAGFYHQQNSALSSTRFQARFGVPVVDFICNHDALLHLEIYEATLTTGRKVPSGNSGPFHNSKNPYAASLICDIDSRFLIIFFSQPCRNRSREPHAGWRYFYPSSIRQV